MRMVRIKRDWKNRFTKSAVHSVTTFKSAVYMSKNYVGTKIDRNVFLKIIFSSFGQWTLFDFLNKLYSTYTKTMKLHWNICSMATILNVVYTYVFVRSENPLFWYQNNHIELYALESYTRAHSMK